MSSTKYHRQQILVDPALQWSIVQPVLVVLLVTVLPFVAMLFLSPDGSNGLVLESSQQARRTSWLMTGCYFGLVLGAMLLALLRATHRIAGPIMVIERGLRRLAEGDASARLSLRERDAAQGLSEAAMAVRQCLMEERDARRRLINELETKLRTGDLGGIRALVLQESKTLGSSQSESGTRTAA